VDWPDAVFIGVGLGSGKDPRIIAGVLS
jgi:hypothetical protein